MFSLIIRAIFPDTYKATYVAKRRGKSESQLVRVRSVQQKIGNNSWHKKVACNEVFLIGVRILSDTNISSRYAIFFLILVSSHPDGYVDSSITKDENINRSCRNILWNQSCR